MRYSFFFIMSLLSLTSIITRAQNVFKVTKSSTIGYLEYLPAGYNNNSEKYPIVIFLHGLGERGPASTDYNTLKNGIGTVERNGPPKYVKYGTDFPFILISPQLKNNYGDWPTWYITEVIDYCRTYLRIDERRIYLTGLSLGGGGAWMEVTSFTQIFAAVAPMCGSRNSPSKASLISSENLPVWAFHGDKDGTVPMSRTVNMINAINACKPAPKPLAKMTIYPGVGHNCWEYAYKPDHSIHNPNVYDWMLSHSNTVNIDNKVPLANAGTDKSISGSSIEIVGSGNDTDGSIAEYTWQKMSGPAATLTNNNSSKLVASDLTTGTYMFKLQVKDSKGDTDSDYVKVTVESGTTNASPTVSAGSDQTITLPTNSIAIAGSASDTDGSIASYQWSKVSGSSASLSGVSSSKLSVSGLVAGSYVFRLTAKDNSGASKYDDMTVIVEPNATTNAIPTASAGPDRTVALPASYVTLFGSAADSDGKIVSYKWTKISGGACALSSATALRPTVSQFVPGVYVFRITVTDDKGAVKSDDVTINFSYPPIVSAGSDKSIALSLSSLVLSGSASDKDGSVKKYSWSKYSGPEVMLTDKDTSKVTLSKLTKGTYVLRFSAWDDAGLQTSDLVTIKVN